MATIGRMWLLVGGPISPHCSHMRDGCVCTVHRVQTQDPAILPVIRIYHDESTYYANADQSFHWTDGTKQVLKQKSLGQAIMVSDFVEEVGGMLECDGEKATFLLEH